MFVVVSHVLQLSWVEILSTFRNLRSKSRRMTSPNEELLDPFKEIYGVSRFDWFGILWDIYIILVIIRQSATICFTTSQMIPRMVEEQANQPLGTAPMRNTTEVHRSSRPPLWAARGGTNRKRPASQASIASQVTVVRGLRVDARAWVLH